jgi:cGMP-dependent protein kinase
MIVLVTGAACVNCCEQDLKLSEVEHLAVLGAGGFGRVTLVRYKGSTYALKQMSKGHIIDNKLVTHVHREKKVGHDCSSKLLRSVVVGSWS